MSINDNLRQLRLNSGMTQAQVAEKLGVTRQALSSYESGRTRPDIDMLMRLCEIYGTDMDGILYGQNRIIKSTYKVKLTACVIFILLTILTFVSSALLWSANHFFSVPEGILTPENRVLFDSRQQLMTAWTIVDKIILGSAFLGFLLLLIMMAVSKHTITLKQKLVYVGILSSEILGISILFAALDPVYRMWDYITIPVFVIARMLFFLIIHLIIDFIQKNVYLSESSA
ncbi:MAG: helix-turn-helix domain-containing protein [Coprococcus sp.]